MINLKIQALDHCPHMVSFKRTGGEGTGTQGTLHVQLDMHNRLPVIQHEWQVLFVS